MKKCQILKKMFSSNDRVHKILPFFKEDSKKIEFLLKEVDGRDEVIKLLQAKIVTADNIIEQLETVRL